MKIDDMAPVCRQVWERAVDSTLGSDVMTDPPLAAHVSSCMTCFRTLAELRDAPRVAAALRAGAPALPVSDRFWDDLAARTTDAAAAALAGTRPPARRRAPRIVYIVAAAAAAAAALLVVGRAPVGPTGAAPAAVTAAVTGEDDEAADAVVDVADLDEPALRRLLDQLRARAPSHVTAIAAGDAQDPADLAFDDDGLANDELVELDGPALQRIERSLAGAAL
jgi:hypothetical protein